MNNQLTLQLVKARHWAYQDAVGELAPQTFIGNDMRHKSFLFQVDRAYERKLHERRAFANEFCGNKFLETLKRGNAEKRKSETRVGDQGPTPRKRSKN